MRAQRRGAWRILALLTILSLIFAACGDDDDDPSAEGDDQEQTTDEQKMGGEVAFAAEQEPESLNWLTSTHNTAWGSYIMGWVWPGTWYADPDNKLVMNEDLVTSVELTSEEPQTVVYKINPEAVWADGKPITSDDFRFYWEAQNGKNPAYDPAGTTGYEDIESVEGTDEGRTVTVTFAKPYADWERLFDYILPAHAFAAAGGGDPVKGFATGFVTETVDLANVVSGGPFKVTAFQKGVSMTLEKNEKYWGEPAFLDKIVIPFITDAAQQPAAMENNEADIGFPQVQIDLLQQVQALPDFVADVGFGTFWEHLDFNLENQHLAVKEVRQAIGKAIDREEIVTRLAKPFSEDAEVLNNRIYKPAEADYEDHGSEEYGEPDLEAAADLLEKAGYAKGSDGIYAKDGNKLSLRVVWRDPNDRRKQTAELLQSQLEELGVDLQLTPQPDFTFLEAGNFDIALFGWTGGTVLSTTRSIYETGGGQNHASHSNPEIDRLYDEANVELDADKRADLMNQIDEVLWEDLPTLPLFQVPELLAYRDNMVGPAYNGFQGPGWNMHQWSLK